MNIKLVVCSTFALWSPLALAQGAPGPDGEGPGLSLSFSKQSDATIKQGGKFGVRQTTLSLSGAQIIDENDLVFLGLEVNQIDIDSDANIPGTTVRIPDQLTGATLSAGWMHEFDNGIGLVTQASIGSLSDKPFKGSDAISLDLNAIANIPHGEYNAWIVGAGFSNESDNALVPILGYSWNPSETFSATIGFPFADVYWQPTENIEVEATISEDPEVSARYYFNDRLSGFASYGQTGFSARRYGRADKDDLLNYEAKTISGGLAYEFDFASIELSAGQSMDGKFSENDDDSTSSDHLDIEDSNFMMLTISAEF